MKKRVVISILIGTVILFLWNAISWMALPFHGNTLNNIPEHVLQTDIMKKDMPESGVYHYPGMPTNNEASTIQEIEAKLQEGPRITLMVYKNSPSKLFEAKTFLFSLFINLLTVIFTLFIVSKVTTEKSRSIFLTTLTIGIVAALVSDISQMNWYMFPTGYTLVNLFDKIISFALLGVLFTFYTFRIGNKA